MCGIAGWVKSNTPYSASALVKAMTSHIAHRGPDDEGFFFSQGVGLGHRRLSVIDLEHGHQPMVTRDGRFVIVYNGMVYNFLTLRRELENSGKTFVTNCDTEVILTAFQHWGTDAFKKFQGMFAFAIWDNQERTLHLTRDPFGIKPLYYVVLANELIFASEIKALFCHPKIPRQMDPLVVAMFLSFNNTFGENSFWSGVKRCMPGEHLKWCNGHLSSFRFFDIGSLEVEPFLGKFEDAANQYRELLSSSVRDHLIADVPVGAYLSSGIDSSSITLLAAKKLDSPISVFTGYFKGYENGWYDERSGALAVSKKGNMVHHQCPITWTDFTQNLEKVAYHLDEPTLGSGAIPQFIVAERARQDVKVVLTGHGGDELFGGYPVFKSLLMREYGIGIKNLQCLCPANMDELMRLTYFLIGGIIDPILARGQFRMFSSYSLRQVTTSTLMSLVNQAGGIKGLLDNFQPFNSKATIDGITRWYIGTYLPTLLVQEDKISMAHGIEGRMPICYEPLIKFSLSLPGSIKLYRGKLKAVPKRALDSILPSILYSLPKRGFPTPIVSWLSGRLGYEWEMQWKNPLPSCLDGLLDKKGIRKEFLKFRKWGYKMPNAYASAHRLISLQMLLGCARGLQSISSVNA